MPQAQTVSPLDQSYGQRDFGAQLAHQIWTTKGSRFGAHRRLRRQEEWSQRAIACLSIYLTVLTIATTMPAFGVGQRASSRITIGSTALSLLLVVFSLLEAGRNYAVRAERLHTCAMRLGTLGSKVAAARELAGGRVTEELIAAAAEYHQLIEACQENHADVDYNLFRAQHRTDFGLSLIQATITRLLVPLRCYGLPVAAVIVPPAAALVLALL